MNRHSRRHDKCEFVPVPPGRPIPIRGLQLTNGQTVYECKVHRGEFKVGNALTIQA